MSGILRLESLTKGNTLKQGDKTPLKYRLFDADGENLNIAGKTAKVRLVYPDFLTIGYEKDGLTVAQDDTVTFTIDGVIPSRIYHVEIIVDDNFIFPSRADETKFTVDKSTLGADANIIEIVGKDVLIQEVKSQVDTELQPLVTSLESAQQAETQRASEESARASAEAQRKTDHANRSAELAGKADKVVLKNLIVNGDFSDGFNGWHMVTSEDTYNIDEGIITVNNSTVGSGIRQGASDYRSGKYYISAHYSGITINIRFRVGLGGEMRVQEYLPDSENMTTYSVIRELVHDDVDTLMVVSQDRLSSYKIDTLSIINLTEIFGAGNEPTKEEMDELIKVIGYIDGEYALNNKEMLVHLMNGIRGKADKKQGDWITPTLLNGTTGNLRFRFTDTGEIQFMGGVKLPTSERGATNICNLPTNLMPQSNDITGNVSWIIGFPIVSSSVSLVSATIVKAELDTYDRTIRIRNSGGESNFEFNTTVNLN